MIATQAPSYRVIARHAQRPTPDWREQLAENLGARPRRLGQWAELGLFGALQCLGAHTPLTQRTGMLVSSQFGAASQMQEALEQAHEGLPLPLTFLQIQPSQLLAALSAQLAWQGDARFVSHAQPLYVLAVALGLAQRAAHDVLVGWVDTHPDPTSYWLHLTPDSSAGAPLGENWVTTPQHDLAHFIQTVTHVRLGASGPAVIIKG